MKTWVSEASPCILALLVFAPAVRGICPSVCTCSGNDRNVDCSSRNLTTLPYGLQDNITYLNLSYNHFVDLNHQLTRFANLRTLDLAHNWLWSLPSHLPRSLWEIYAAHNNIKILQKLDTAYQWNLKVLDVSGNMVERVVLINNTLSSLKVLNLSSNTLWTVPTNIPHNIETVDLSNNFLTQILPGTLTRLSHLSTLYLHNNKFTYIPDKALDHLTQLQLITLYNNPWACRDNVPALSYLKKWIAESSTTVLGQPCSHMPTAPRKSATPFSAAPAAAAESHLLVKAMKAAESTGSPTTTEQTKLAHQPFRMKDARLSGTASQGLAFTSAGWPLVLHPEGLSTEKLSSYEAAAATRAVYIQDPGSVSSSTIGLAGSLTTPMTLSITSGVPTNYSKRPQSTTATAKTEESTTKINPRLHSQANTGKGYSLLIAMLATVALATGYGFVLK